MVLAFLSSYPTDHLTQSSHSTYPFSQVIPKGMEIVPLRNASRSPFDTIIQYLTMPLFGSKNEEPAPVEQPQQRGSIFSRNGRNSGDLDRSNTNSTNGTGKSSFFARGGRSNSEEDLVGKDPSIKGARQKVKDAEAAEKDADRALIAAKNAVRAARDHAQMLEREALEE